MKKCALWFLVAMMFIAAITAGCGGSNSDAPDTEQTESLTDDTGEYDPNEGGKGISGTFINLSNIYDQGQSHVEMSVHGNAPLTGTPGLSFLIKVDAGVTITLRDVTMDKYNKWETFKRGGLSFAGDATIILEGTNYVKNFDAPYPVIYVPEGHTLTIKGSGKLTADASSTSSAGIGGCTNLPCGNILIEEGTIEAIGGEGSAGIGGGKNSNCGTITITGGKVRATKGKGAQHSIGAGEYGSCGTVTLPDQVGPSSADPYIYPPDKQ